MIRHGVFHHVSQSESCETGGNPGGVVSRKSVAHLIVQLAMNPALDLRCSLGVHKVA